MKKDELNRCKDGWGKTCKYTDVPDYIKELNKNPIEIEYKNDDYWFSRHLKLENNDFRIDVLFEINSDGTYRMYTDDLKYGEHLEIIYDKDIGMFNVKGIKKLRDEWKRNHGESVVENVDVLERLLV